MTGVGEQTRQKILDAALARFRDRGFDGTTMRDVAADAGVALGAAYHYFASKDALVAEYYADVQRQHRAATFPALARTHGLGQRIRIVMHSKIDVVRHDRKLLGALFRNAGDPESPLSLFGPETRAVRDDSIALFDAAIDHPDIPEEQRPILALALWTLHLGVLLYFVHDKSAAQRKTRELIDGAMEIVDDVLHIVPLLRPMLTRVAPVLIRAGLLRGTDNRRSRAHG